MPPRPRIPLSAPDVTEGDIEAVAAVLRSPDLSLGPRLDAFEAGLAACAETEHAVAVSSGTAGLHLALRALDVGPGHEVVVPSFAFVAPANAARYVGARPVFADVEPLTLNLDPARVEAALTPRTRAVVVVHTFGCPADMDALGGLARRHGLALVEDACEAIGATWAGRRVGGLGDAGVFAFYPNKQITTGEGGALVTSDARLAARVRSLRNQGRVPGGDWWDHQELGYNYRLSDINCALGLAQLARLDAILERRAQVARAYHERLAGHPDLVLPPLEVEGRRRSWFVYALRLAERFTTAERDAIRERLAASGIACGRYFAPVHAQPAYAALGPFPPLPVTESAARRSLALPFFNRIREEEVAEVCDALVAACRSC